jgi:hypothetical protein
MVPMLDASSQQLSFWERANQRILLCVKVAYECKMKDFIIVKLLK